ncbi:hypothetical protein, partial [Cytobacillus oceanisediminis]|uniref:hypothetical protein n=1 Tax=Cytobacillus oceanisediminis TaxID=665099 RepID=UPI001C92E88B
KKLLKDRPLKLNPQPINHPKHHLHPQKQINLLPNPYLPQPIKNITPPHIIPSITYFFNFLHAVPHTDHIDHLPNTPLP